MERRGRYGGTPPSTADKVAARLAKSACTGPDTAKAAVPWPASAIVPQPGAERSRPLYRSKPCLGRLSESKNPLEAPTAFARDWCRLGSSCFLLVPWRKHRDSEPFPRVQAPPMPQRCRHSAMIGVQSPLGAPRAYPTRRPPRCLGAAHIGVETSPTKRRWVSFDWEATSMPCRESSGWGSDSSDHRREESRTSSTAARGRGGSRLHCRRDDHRGRTWCGSVPRERAEPLPQTSHPGR